MLLARGLSQAPILGGLGGERNIPAGVPRKPVAVASTLGLGLFVAMPVMPLVAITHYPATPALVALVTASAAAANVSKVVYLRIFRS